MPVRKSSFVLIGFLSGIAVSLLVSGYVPEDRRTILQWYFVVPLAGSAQDFISPNFASQHRLLLYSVSALLHGLFVALLLILAFRLIPRLTLARMALTLATVVIIDIAFMVFLVPAGPD